ncbi:MAG: Endonuclease III [Phycisphaerae bacterium]|nr:Endonuclease III [Phycisphaerae bacterium]
MGKPPNRPGDLHRMVRRVIQRLQNAYGRQVWRRHGNGLDLLVDTILSQNTNNTNSDRAYEQLRADFADWQAVADAPAARIERSIRSAGLSRQKSVRIRAILRAIRQERGQLDLEFLADLPAADARAWLRRFKGVGPKTVGCVLLFAFNQPVLPVDTHIHRIAIRLGLIAPGTSAEAAHAALEALVPPAEFYNFHILVIMHGRQICKAHRPRCHDCVLRRTCPASAEFIRRGQAAGSVRD